MELEPQISPSSRLFSTAQLLHVAAIMKSAAILTLVMRMHSSNRNRSQETVHPIYNIRWASFWIIWIWDSEPHQKKTDTIFRTKWAHVCPSHGWCWWWHAHRPVELWVPFHGQKKNSWNDDTWSNRTRKACEVSCRGISLKLELSIFLGML